MPPLRELTFERPIPSHARLANTRALSRTADDAPAETIRVCHVSMSLQTGGLERLLVDFSRFHDRQRFALSFAALSGDGQPAAEIRAAGFPVRVFNDSTKIRKLRTIRELARVCRTERVQILHTHNTYAQFYGTIAAKLAGVPVIVNTQHGRGCGESWKALWQFRLANRLTDRIVGVSQDAVSICRRQDSSSARKMTAIWNGINLARFAHRGPRDDLSAMTVARLSREKDFPTLLHAVKVVVTQRPDFQLRIVGDGPERAAIERLLDDLELRGYVAMLGERQDVAELLGDSGFFISSSRSEGLSLTLLEAMAVGLPIVATNVGGNPEVVEHGRTGRLVPACDPAALAHAILEMCHDRDAWTAMGLLGRKRVEEHFEIHHMVAEYERLYEELLKPLSHTS